MSRLSLHAARRAGNARYDDGMPDPHAEFVPPSPTPEDPARRLAEASARSPELAAMLSRGPRRPRRPALRAVAIGGAALAVAVGAGALALRARRSPEAPPAPERLWAGTLLAPVGASGAAGSGERTAPFSGFALQVETEPAGAVVEVDGVVRGESPVFAGVECAPGARVVVRARSRGAAAERTTTCRKDTLVGLTLRLGR
jgi:hypothetical protein